MSNPDYVTTAAWTAAPGRPDHIDEIADQFERPTHIGAEDFWSGTQAGWPSAHRRHGLGSSAGYLERRAG